MRIPFGFTGKFRKENEDLRKRMRFFAKRTRTFAKRARLFIKRTRFFAKRTRTFAKRARPFIKRTMFRKEDNTVKLANSPQKIKDIIKENEVLRKENETLKKESDLLHKKYDTSKSLFDMLFESDMLKGFKGLKDIEEYRPSAGYHSSGSSDGAMLSLRNPLPRCPQCKDLTTHTLALWSHRKTSQRERGAQVSAFSGERSEDPFGCRN